MTKVKAALALGVTLGMASGVLLYQVYTTNAIHLFGHTYIVPVIKLF